jgi:hypothetical protein
MPKEVILFGCQAIEIDIPRFLINNKDIEVSKVISYEVISDNSRGQESIISVARDLGIAKSARGLFNVLVWFKCENNIPKGCCSVWYKTDQMASIGLFRIDPSCSGKAFGSLLMQNVLYAMFHKNNRTVSVVTQGKNFGAQSLYQRAGFCNEKMEIYYHKWFIENQGDWS